MAIETVPPLIATQLNYLLSNCPFSIKVEQMWSGCKNPSLLDRFTVVIPFCLDYIRWDIIYNAVYPLVAPDIIFGREDETFEPYHVASEKSSDNSLTDWNSKDPSRLLSLIMELRDADMAYQRKRIEEVDDDRLKFEISTMLSRKKKNLYRLPFACVGNADDLCSQPVPAFFALGCIHLFSEKRLNLQFLYWPWIQINWLLGPPGDISRRYTYRCMAEYLPTLEEMLESQIKDAVSSIELRRKFIVALTPLFGRPIEADPVFCTRATFLASSGVFTFLVHFNLSLQFPKQKPSLLLQSSQHFSSHGVPVKSHNMTEYPWSSRWEASQMAERIFEFLVEECLNFKKYCNQLNQQ